MQLDGRDAWSGEDERRRDRDADESETNHEAPRGIIGQREGGQGDTARAHDERHDGEHGDLGGRTCAHETLRTHYPDIRREAHSP